MMICHVWTLLQCFELWKVMVYFQTQKIAFRILLTIPVATVLTDQSFFKLKLMKNCLRIARALKRLYSVPFSSKDQKQFEKFYQVMAVLTYSQKKDTLKNKCIRGR